MNNICNKTGFTKMLYYLNVFLIFYSLFMTINAVPLNAQNMNGAEQPVDEYGNPLWDYRDGNAYIIRSTPIYSCPSKKCKIINTLDAGCPISYYAPVESEGYGEWLRLKNYSCLKGDQLDSNDYVDAGYVLKKNTDWQISNLLVYPFDRNIDDNGNDFDFQIRSCENQKKCPIVFDSRTDDPNVFFVYEKKEPLPKDKDKRTGCFFVIEKVNSLSLYDYWLYTEMFDDGCKSKNPKWFGAASFKLFKKPRAPFDINEALNVGGYRPAGGFVLAKNEPITINAQALVISMDKVEINSVYENKTNKDITTNVFFSLPPLEIDPKTHTSDDIQKFGIDMSQLSEKDRFVDFEVWVDGKRIDLNGQRQIIKTASQDKDVLQISFYWQQAFPAGKPVTMRVVYKPLSGKGSPKPISTLLKTINNEKVVNEFCIDKGFINGVSLKQKAGYETGVITPVGYLLTANENWNDGIIGGFRLVIDKGDPDNLISLCGDGVKKISSTQFEIKAQNYRPQDNLSILILNAWEK
ncbi:DUF4424 domain-containing protein [Bartonella sp. HY329]|uniref:DUF4424 domain-containing protein n=1 Tax=unclassified Bartonella TaxID=2645622 RepID=UPI0021C7F30C|nr:MULTISPECIES: DUF4424 domain-containing protein [unclassified Bartonella]UXM94104.1 DUF4424 domain-containing protein [Bartonella sp. HY329]UXN08426.1 DUF4424 domain-containing protein [Bartonella sp. HY328]